MATYAQHQVNCELAAEEKRVALRKDMTLYIGCGHKYVEAGCAMYPGCMKETVFSHIHIINCSDYMGIDVFDPVIDFLFESLDQFPTGGV